jgi:hypothetical protein
MTKNEDLRGLMRLYNGRNYVPNFRGKLFEDEDLKTTKIGETGPRKQNHVPWAHGMRLGHGKNLPCAFGIYHAPWAYSKMHFMRPEHLKCEGRKRNFMFF